MHSFRRFLTLLALTVMGIATCMGATVSIPQETGKFIDWNNATLSNANVENSGKNIGSTHNGSTATFTLSNATAQGYYMTLKTGASGLTAVLAVTVKNGSDVISTNTINVSNTGSWSCTEQHDIYVGTLPVSSNTTLEIKVTSTTGSYAGNYGDLALYPCAEIPSSNIINLANGTHSGCRVEDAGNVGYVKNGCYSVYTVNNTAYAYMKIKADFNWFSNAGQFKVTVTDLATNITELEESFDITAKENGKELAFSGPLTKGLKSIRCDYTSTADGYLFNYTNMTIEKVADFDPDAAVTLKSLTVNGTALNDDGLAALKNDGGTYTLSGTIITSLPVVEAKFNNLVSASIASKIDGDKVTYTLTGTKYTSTLIIEGLHTYTATSADKTVQLKYTSDGKSGAGNWSNGVYSVLSDRIDGWDNSGFKFNSTKNTITVPSNVVVKQLTLKDFKGNYTDDTGDGLTSVDAGTAATVWLPTKHSYVSNTNPYDVIVPIENHQAGTPLVLTIEGTRQPNGWFELIVEEVNAGNPTVSSTSATVVDNHAVITVGFDRAVKDASVVFNGTTVTAEGGSTSLTFAVWDLDFGKDYSFVIPKAQVVDSYGNTATEDVTVEFSTADKPAVEQKGYDYVVSTKAELDDAIAAVKKSNLSASAERKTIFLKNGTYTYGTLTGSYQHNIAMNVDNWNYTYNVSIIGESKEGVLIEGITDGITSSTFDLGSGTGIYLQDLTLRNNYDYPNADKGVSVALTGGNKSVLKNVALQACQDTYVTGKRTYLETCDIYGTTDFICGGGDIFFESCNLLIGNKSGAVIVAPNTNPDVKWGYVFQNCTVDKSTVLTKAADKNWNLGRPWGNEPKAYFLNTTMNILPTDAGWTKMSSLVTHFYEYNSMDKNGKALDLSVRQNSSTSINTYKPVLTDDEAATFTLRNVLGGSDSWDAIDETRQCEAPVLSGADGNLSWNAVDGAMLYVVLKDGAYLDNVTTTSFAAPADGVYTVKAANKNGGLGTASNSVNATASGIVTVSTSAISAPRKMLRNNSLIITDGCNIFNAAGAKIK